MYCFRVVHPFLKEEISVKKEKNGTAKEKKEKKPNKIIAALGGFIKKHKVITVIICLLVCGLIVGVAKKSVKKPEVKVPTTFTLEKRDINTTVTGSGKIVSGDKSDIIISNLANNKLLTIDVKVGDLVSAGDVLCTFDTTDIEYDLADAKASLAAGNVTSGNSVDRSSRAVYDDRLDGANDLVRKQEAVDEAARILGTKQGELAEAARIYEEIESIYGEIYSESKYYSLLEEEAKNPGKFTKADELQQQRTAKQAIADAKNSEDTARRAVNDAEKALKSAQQSLDDSTRDDIIKVYNSEDSLEDAQANSSVNGQATKKSIRQLEGQIKAATVTAPISGYVTAVNYVPGNVYTGNTLLTIEDTSKYKIEVNIDEYDISDIKVGQRVTFKTNATSDEELDAVVTEVAIRATTSNTSGSTSTSSTPTYKVTMEIISVNDRIRLDMTAKLSIITAEAKDTFAVPAEAIMYDGDEAYIEVIPSVPEADKPMPESRRIYVTTGLVSSYYTQIESDELTDGMIIVIPGSDDEMNLDNLIMMSGPGGAM